MESGKLRHRGTIEQLGSTLDDRGQRVQTWSTVVSGVFYSRQAAAAGEVIRGRQTVAEATQRLRIRYRSGLTPKMRLVDGSRVFHFLAVSDVDDRTRTLEIDAKETV
jgi:SPP1 family predicted phage head-tail adaptor